MDRNTSQTDQTSSSLDTMPFTCRYRAFILVLMFSFYYYLMLFVLPSVTSPGSFLSVSFIYCDVCFVFIFIYMNA